MFLINQVKRTCLHALYHSAMNQILCDTLMHKFLSSTGVQLFQ